jgi:hypothetical protein
MRPGGAGTPLGRPGDNVSVPVRQSAITSTDWVRAATSISRTPQKARNNAIRQLEAMGYHVTLN